MDKGYIDNGFIVDLSHTKKTSEIIYELSRVLDMPESKEKQICLKLGTIDLSNAELSSIRTLVELMESKLEYISTSSEKTLEAASELGIKISQFTNELTAPSFQNENLEVEKALDHIFGENDADTEKTMDQEKVSVAMDSSDLSAPIIDEEQVESDEKVMSNRDLIENMPTLYIRKTIRSGQSISSDGNILIVGDVNPGAEIIAKGDITVWGILAGIAHAGSEENNFARIRALKLNPVQIRIGNIFARRPDTVNVPYIQKSSEYTPEEAFAYKDTIIIKKIHDEN